MLCHTWFIFTATSTHQQCFTSVNSLQHRPQLTPEALPLSTDVLHNQSSKPAEQATSQQLSKPTEQATSQQVSKPAQQATSHHPNMILPVETTSAATQHSLVSWELLAEVFTILTGAHPKDNVREHINSSAATPPLLGEVDLETKTISHLGAHHVPALQLLHDRHMFHQEAWEYV